MDNPKVLIVDDIPNNITLLVKILSKLKVDISTASSGFEAVEQAKETEFAMVLLDISMPGMDGYEAAKRILEIELNANIAIIFITAINTDERHVFKGYQFGAVEYMIKPVDAFLLTSKVKIFCKLYEQRKQLESRNQELQEANLALTLEIGKRRDTEEDLIQTQHYLTNILDSSEDCMIAFNDKVEITFFNQGAAELFQVDGSVMIGKPVTKLFSDSFQPSLATHLEKLSKGSKMDIRFIHPAETLLQCPAPPSQPIEVSLFRFIGRQKATFGLILKIMSAEGDEGLMLQALPIISEVNRNRKKVKAIEKAFENITQVLTVSSNELIQNLRSIDSSFNKFYELFSVDKDVTHLRESLVLLMNIALEYWEKAKNQGKIELAEQSNLWSVSINNGVYRTKTLDKYLNINTLPKNPRWKTVLDTAQYVLANCPDNDELKPRLNIELERFRGLIQQKSFML